jgi:hypothetical protein
MEMTWAIAALVVFGLAATSAAIRRVARKQRTLKAIMDVDRAVLEEMVLLFLSDEVTTPRRDGSADPWVTQDGRSADRPPEGLIECGIDVVDATGRIIGTAVIPAPVSN